jgi:hypothetical protein
MFLKPFNKSLKGLLVNKPSKFPITFLDNFYFESLLGPQNMSGLPNNTPPTHTYLVYISTDSFISEESQLEISEVIFQGHSTECGSAGLNLTFLSIRPTSWFTLLLQWLCAAHTKFQFSQHLGLEVLKYWGLIHACTVQNFWNYGCQKYNQHS